jgi:glycosyltransferase involved in cell wall biosynthesis
MVVAGITMVRNEIDVIEFCIEHHLSQGLDYIYICDNGSTDGTYEYLLKKSNNDSRIILTRGLGDFHQQAIINNLSNKAYQDGCDWIVPFDADELWFSLNTLKNDLKNISRASVRIELKNFVQSSEVLNPINNTYLNTKWRLPDNAISINLDDVVDGTVSMIENPAFYKYIVRTSPNLIIAPGAHSYSGQDPIFVINKNFDAYHIPIRSYKALQIKAEQGQRLIDAGYNPGHGWHVQRYAKLNNNGLLHDEWMHNSETNGKITRQDGTQRDLYFRKGQRKNYCSNTNNQ